MHGFFKRHSISHCLVLYLTYHTLSPLPSCLILVILQHLATLTYPSSLMSQMGAKRISNPRDDVQGLSGVAL